MYRQIEFVVALNTEGSKEAVGSIKLLNLVFYFFFVFVTYKT